jgi:predicted  nucleic acid-binding Zn-ribbon protein
MTANYTTQSSHDALVLRKEEGVPAEGTRGDGEEVRTLREEVQTLREEGDKLRNELVDARRGQDDKEKTREEVRARLALVLVGLLSFVLVAT